jgi:AraC family transcriptional regulator, transcriptional activator of the genes for pyochelin and ferripyochelin receptors
MISKFTSLNGGDIYYSAVIPPALTGCTIPDPRGLFATGDFGAAILYELNCPAFSVWYCQYIMRTTAWLYSTSEKAVLELQMMLHHDLQYQLEGIGQVRIPERHFNMTYVPYIKNKVLLKEGHHYSMMDIHFSPEYLERYAYYFPPLAELLKRQERNAASLLCRKSIAMTAEMDIAVMQLLQCEYTGDMKAAFIESKVSELLLRGMYRVSGDKESAFHVRLLNRDLEKIREARDYILYNMDQPCTLIELAHKVGINDFKLKKGFKQLYGTTLFDFLLNARIDKARMLLAETNMPIQDIALATGYKNITGFSAAFKKKTGYPPGSIRRRG